MVSAPSSNQGEHRRKPAGTYPVLSAVKGLKETPSLDLASLPRSVTDEAERYRGLLFYHRGSLRPATARERVNASPHDPTNRWRDKSSRSPALFQEAGACRATLTTLPMRYASFEVRTSLTRVDAPRSSIEKPEH